MLSDYNSWLSVARYGAVFSTLNQSKSNMADSEKKDVTGEKKDEKKGKEEIKEQELV